MVPLSGWFDLGRFRDVLNELVALPPPILFVSFPGSSQVPFFFYEYAVMANLWSIGDIDKEFIITVNIIRDIYRGKITKWNDSRLTALNQGMVMSNR